MNDNNTVKRYGSQGREDLLKLKAESLVLITDEKHPLYDARVHLPVDESMVESVLLVGIIEPILVRRAGENEDGSPIIEVINGRQRVKAVLEANRRLKKQGADQEILVPARTRRGEDNNLFLQLVVANEVRIEDTQVERARKAQKLLDYGFPAEKVMTLFHYESQQGLENLLAILECSGPIIKAIEDGTIAASHAPDFRKLPHEKQKQRLQEMVSTGVTKGRAAKKAIRNGKPTKTKKVKSRSYLESWIADLQERKSKDAKVAIAVLEYVLGIDKAIKPYATIRPKKRD